MKQLFKLFAASFLLIALYTGCSKSGTTTPAAPAPTADFTYTGTGNAPATVTFTNTSTNATSYAWDFGNNGTSTLANPSYTYTTAGVYTVRLTATGAGGSTSTTKTINITAPTTLRITNVRLTNIPYTTSTGGAWDVFPNSGPDAYVTITDNASTVFYNHPKTYSDVISANMPLDFMLQNNSAVSTPLIITSANFSALKAVLVYDWDNGLGTGGYGDFMGGVTFTPANYTTGASPYPTQITLTSGSVTAVLTLQWQ